MPRALPFFSGTNSVMRRFSLRTSIALTTSWMVRNCSAVAATMRRFSVGSASMRGGSVPGAAARAAARLPEARLPRVRATSSAAANCSGMMRYSIADLAGDSSSCESSLSITGKLSGVAVTTSEFERGSAMMRAFTCTAGRPGSRRTATPCVRPFASSCSEEVRMRTASSARAFVSAKVRMTVSSALAGASRRSTSDFTCSRATGGADTMMLLVRTSGEMLTPWPPERPRNCSPTRRAISDAWPLRSTMISLRRSPPDCGWSRRATRSRMVESSSGVPATSSAPPEADATMVAALTPPAPAALRSSRNCFSVVASSAGVANCTGTTALWRPSCTSVFASESRSALISRCCASVARTTSFRERTTGITREPLPVAAVSHGRSCRSPIASRTSPAIWSTSPALSS